MINLISEKPTIDLHGRLKFITKFVKADDLINKKVLDIGCGFGWFELFALSQKPKTIVGTEISLKDLQTINKNLHEPRLKTCVGDATNLPFKNNSFDTVVSWEVLEHVKKGTDHKMFKEVARVIKKGGHFYLSTPNSSFWSVMFDPAWYLLSHRHYSLDTISKMAEKSGLSVIESYIKGGFWDIILTLDMYFSKWVLNRPPLFGKKLNLLVDKEYQSNGTVSLCVKLMKC